MNLPTNQTQTQRDAPPLTGAELQTLRESCHLTRDELGDLAGVQGRTVKHWENGRATVPQDVAALMHQLNTQATQATRQAINAIKDALRDAEAISIQRVGSADEILFQTARPVDLVQLRYRSAADLHRYRPDLKGTPLGIHSAIVARVHCQTLELGAPARVIWFDPEAYEAWLDALNRNDTEAHRAQWATSQGQPPR